MSLLSVERVRISFDGLVAVDDVSLTVQPGEIVSVIGPNGSGKTTLFNMISGLYVPDSGRVMLGNENITAVAPQKLAARGLSRTFQNLQIFLQMTVLENVMTGRHLTERGYFLADLLGLPGSRRRTRATESEARKLLARVGLTRVTEREAASLSYGALKRLEIARALATEPRLLLLDEPAAGANLVETEEINRLIARIARDGVAILLIEHDMKLVMGISNHIVVLDHGVKIAEGTPDEVARNQKVIEAYLGIRAEGTTDALG